MSTVSRVLAGAGMATGAVLLCAACVDPNTSLNSVVEGIGDWLKGLFTSNFKLSEFLSTGTGKATMGAALLGAGYALHRSHHHENMVNIDDTPQGMLPDDGFAVKMAMERAAQRGRMAVMQQMGAMQAGHGIG